MSENITNFIPEDPYYELEAAQIEAIKRMDWYKDDFIIEVNETVEYLLVGENFGDILCPFCKEDLSLWWGEAMDAAYTKGKGFGDIAVTTPCCDKETTLQNLDYSPQQGLYKSIVMTWPELVFSPDAYIEHFGEKIPIGSLTELDEEGIRGQLQDLTGISWRIVHSCN